MTDVSMSDGGVATIHVLHTFEGVICSSTFGLKTPRGIPVSYFSETIPPGPQAIAYWFRDVGRHDKRHLKTIFFTTLSDGKVIGAEISHEIIPRQAAVVRKDIRDHARLEYGHFGISDGKMFYATLLPEPDEYEEGRDYALVDFDTMLKYLCHHVDINELRRNAQALPRRKRYYERLGETEIVMRALHEELVETRRDLQIAKWRVNQLEEFKKNMTYKVTKLSSDLTSGIMLLLSKRRRRAIAATEDMIDTIAEAVSPPRMSS